MNIRACVIIRMNEREEGKRRMRVGVRARERIMIMMYINVALRRYYIVINTYTYGYIHRMYMCIRDLDHIFICVRELCE